MILIIKELPKSGQLLFSLLTYIATKILAVGQEYITYFFDKNISGYIWLYTPGSLILETTLPGAAFSISSLLKENDAASVSVTTESNAGPS